MRTYCITHGILLCGDKKWIYDIQLIHFAIQKKLTQPYCNVNFLKFKKAFREPLAYKMKAKFFRMPYKSLHPPVLAVGLHLTPTETVTLSYRLDSFSDSQAFVCALCSVEATLVFTPYPCQAFFSPLRTTSSVTSVLLSVFYFQLLAILLRYTIEDYINLFLYQLEQFRLYLIITKNKNLSNVNSSPQQKPCPTFHVPYKFSGSSFTQSLGNSDWKSTILQLYPMAQVTPELPQSRSDTFHDCPHFLTYTVTVNLEKITR